METKSDLQGVITPPPYPHKLHFMIYPYKYPLNRRFLFTKPPLTHNNKIQGSRLRFFQLQGLRFQPWKSKWPSETMWNYCWWFWNPASSPVELGKFPHYLQGFIHPKGGFYRSSEPSTVVTTEWVSHFSNWVYPWQLVTVVSKLFFFLTYLGDEINLRIQGWKDIHWS